MKYEVKLIAHGNCDRVENPHKKICPSEAFRGNTIEEMQKAVREFITRNNLGAGNICMVDVMDLDKNEVVGQISYNGRYWEGGYRRNAHAS